MNYSKICTFIICICSLLISNNVSGQEFNFSGNLKKGTYNVGLRIVEQVDNSRAFYQNDRNKNDKFSGNRNIRIYVWYPAEKSPDNRNMFFEEYVKLMMIDYSLITDEKGKLDMEKVKALNLFRGVNEDNHTTILRSETSSVRNAEPAANKFPLIVFGQGLYYESPVSHFIICEYLASHGYVVATCPLYGTDSRFVNYDVRGIHTQIRDMEFVISYCMSLPYVEDKTLGVMGFDLGAQSGLLLAMKNENVDVLVTIDGGMMIATPADALRQSSHYNVDNMRVPLMHLTRTERGLFEAYIRHEQSLFNTSKFSDIYIVGIDGSQHVNFNSYSMFGLENQVPMYWGPMDVDGRAAHETVCMYALNFLDAHLKKSQKAADFINDDPEKHFSGISIKKEKKSGIEPPPKETVFLNLIYNGRSSDAVRLYQKVKGKFPGTTILNQAVINRLGYEYMYKLGAFETAVDIFKLNVLAFPESANAYDSLAESYLNAGKIEQAVKNYKKSLELNPENTNAQEILKRFNIK
ncbi:tetratricopeptide repeat protein [candidate division KSB1 bacterium]